MTLYVDIIFLENIFMNSIILLATGVILKAPIRILRNLIASTIGSIYAIIIYVSNIEIYSNFFLKLVLSFAIIYVAFKPVNIKSFLKYVVIFYLTSFTFGGVAFALLYFVSPQDILLQDGVLIGTYPMKIILAGGILGFIIITISFKNIKGRLNKKDMFCNITLNSSNKKTKITAIIDTGNFLRDPITKIPVIVVEKDKLNELLPEIILDNVTNIINGKNVAIYGSQGQQRSSIISLKLAEAEVIYDEIEEYPVILLDDFMSELDEKRRRKFVENITEAQVILTGTHKLILENLNYKIYNVKDGHVKIEE